MSVFVVFEEGGEYCSLSLTGWLRVVLCGVPIMGVRIGRRRFIYDRIISRFRTSRDYI